MSSDGHRSFFLDSFAPWTAGKSPPLFRWQHAGQIGRITARDRLAVLFIGQLDLFVVAIVESSCATDLEIELLRIEGSTGFRLKCPSAMKIAPASTPCTGFGVRPAPGTKLNLSGGECCSFLFSYRVQLFLGMRTQDTSLGHLYCFSTPSEEFCNLWNSRICASASAVLPCLR
jgi:hypothetical protein